MMTSTTEHQQRTSPTTYAWYVGSVYLFNQMIGTGLLAMPKAFVEVGWVLGLIIPCVLAFMSYCTATYVLEAHAIHNAITKYTPILKMKANKCKDMKEIVVIYEEGVPMNGDNPADADVLVVDRNTKIDVPERIHKDSGCVIDDRPHYDYDGQDYGSVVSFGSQSQCSDQLIEARNNGSDQLFDIKDEESDELSEDQDEEFHQLVDSEDDGIVSVFESCDGGFQGENGIDGEALELGKKEESDGENLYEIGESVELGDLCKLFFNTTGQVCYYVTICLYLTGAEAVYFATIGKSLTSTICCDAGRSSCFGVNDTNACNGLSSISIKTTYRLTILTISAACLPMAFLNLSKTRYIQIMTMVYRWFAIITMIALAVVRIVTGQGPKRSPRMASFEHIPNFSGIMLFGFLIQYSISNVVTPVRNKKMLKKSLVLVYICVIIVTSLLTMTAAYGFNESDILDLYTSNFVNPVFFKYALELYPVLALCANIPIFAITLRENLKTLFLRGKDPHSSCRIHVFVLPVLALVPSVAVSLYTYDVVQLVAFTGSYAGAIVQYVIPTILVILARAKAKKLFGRYENNRYQSPFHYHIWSVIVLVWYVACVLITVYKTF